VILSLAAGGVNCGAVHPVALFVHVFFLRLAGGIIANGKISNVNVVICEPASDFQFPLDIYLIESK